jgi:hypothetical protein
MKSNFFCRRLLLFFWPVLLLAIPSFAESINETNSYWAIPLSSKQSSNGSIINRYGVPFVRGTLAFSSKGSARLNVGSPAKRIFLLGMTTSAKISGWSDPTNYFVRYFIGDELGQIQLDYVDGTRQTFPLILGQSLWWPPPFNLFPEQTPSSSARLRKAFEVALRLYPPTPVADGNYVAVITPKAVPLKSIIVETSPAKKGPSQPVQFPRHSQNLLKRLRCVHLGSSKIKPGTS